MNGLKWLCALGLVVGNSALAKPIEEDLCRHLSGDWHGSASYPEFDMQQSWQASYHPDGRLVLVFTSEHQGAVSESQEVGVWHCYRNLLRSIHAPEGAEDGMEPMYYHLRRANQQQIHYVSVSDNGFFGKYFVAYRD